MLQADGSYKEMQVLLPPPAATPPPPPQNLTEPIPSQDTHHYGYPVPRITRTSPPFYVEERAPIRSARILGNGVVAHRDAVFTPLPPVMQPVNADPGQVIIISNPAEAATNVYYTSAVGSTSGTGPLLVHSKPPTLHPY